MNRLLNWFIALLVPSMIGCGNSKKVQEIPEEIYACPMPTDPVQDDPEEELPNDTLTINNQ